MTKRLTALFFMVLFCASFVAAQSNVVRDKKMRVPSDQTALTFSQSSHTNSPAAAGMLFINTDYDYPCNNTIGPMIVTGPDIDGDGTGDPLFTAMQRFDGGQRKVMFGYLAFGLIDAQSAFDETDATSGSTTYGWGTIQYCVGGPLDGQAYLQAHSGGSAYQSYIDLVNLAPITPFSTVTFGGNFPSFVYLADGNMLATTTDAEIYASTDQGGTWDAAMILGEGDTNVDWANAADTPSEFPIYKSDDDQTIAIVSIGQGVNVADTNKPDIVYWYGSTDGGGSWSGQIIGYGSSSYPLYGQVVNRNYAPYFENFSQFEVNVSNDGVTHVAVNGYGEGVLEGTTDTINTFPIYYWNSRDANWMAITDPSTEGDVDADGNAVSDYYPGNGIGQAYPNIATSDDGSVVVVVWQGYEYTGAVGNSAFNIYPGDGGANSFAVYYTDLYYVISQDGGQTWSAPAILKGDPNVMEVYPEVNKRLMIDGSTATLSYMYMEDVNPGVSLFSENDASNDNAWYYDTMDFSVTSVKNDKHVVNSFELSQNYPNPFNPTTMIKYSVAERGNVSLKVYDMLGREVATLVNTTKDAGSYEVNFDASKLSSGVYVYTLNAGKFSESKKMMLMK